MMMIKKDQEIVFDWYCIADMSFNQKPKYQLDISVMLLLLLDIRMARWFRHLAVEPRVGHSTPHCAFLSGAGLKDPSDPFQLCSPKISNGSILFYRLEWPTSYTKNKKENGSLKINNLLLAYAFMDGST